MLNGREWFAWAHTNGGPPPSDTKAGVLRASSADLKHWRVSFTPAAYTGRYDVHAALLASGLVSDVKAEENRGRRLNHDFVVTVLANSSLAAGQDGVEGEFAFEGTKNEKPGRLALAVWVTRPESLEPLQAIGAWLSD